MEESGGLEVSIATTTSARVSARLTQPCLAIFDYADCTASLNEPRKACPR